MSTPTFVVGTGRCGSTMLSNMLREHPRVLSLSEFFGWVSEGGNVPDAFSAEAMDGKRFWGIVGGANAPLANFAYRQGLAVPEILYDYTRPEAHFSRESGVPSILMTALPHLTRDCDGLFDLLAKEVVHWPSAHVGEHYRRLFEWLLIHFDKRLWIERSGQVRMTSQLLEHFPDARFIHLVRDGRNSALSMQQHLIFRLGLLMYAIADRIGVNPILSSDRSEIARLPDELRPFLPEQFDVDAFLSYRIEGTLCGSFWFQELETGINALAELPTDRLLTLRYEDFLTDAKRQLDTLAAFLGEEFVDEDWSARCAATVRQPRSTWRDLPEDEARALTDACRPGFELLREAGVKYEF